MCLLKAERKFTFGSIGIGGHLGSPNLILPALRTHTLAHGKTHGAIQKRPKLRSAAQIQCAHKASMSGSDYYVVWLQVQSDLLADDERERNRATDGKKKEKERERFHSS